MKFNFFVPETKVHRQRRVMKHTDFRMARYSRHELLLSIAFFSSFVFFTQMYHAQPMAMSISGIAIAGISACRAYYLFRLKPLYARGPARWRNRFFVITLLGAAIWGTMLAVITYLWALTVEVLMVWLYTLAFLTSCSHAFSPYQRFYCCYLILCFVPCSLVALLSLDGIGMTLGVMMLVFAYMLNRQSDTLPGILGAFNRCVLFRTKSERPRGGKITSQSSLSSRELYFQRSTTTSSANRGGSEFELVLNEQQQERQPIMLSEQKTKQQIAVLKNVWEFSQISRDAIILADDVIDLRGLFKAALATISDQGISGKLNCWFVFRPIFQRIGGDGERLTQLLTNMVWTALNYTNNGCLLVDVKCLGETDKVNLPWS